MNRQAQESRRDGERNFMSRGRDRDRDNEPIDESCVDPTPNEDDAESELLRELARQVDLSRSTRPAPEEPRPDVDPRMQVFLDTAPEPATRRSVHLHVPDVEIDDLVEELATTAAALRARRAA